MIKLQLHENWQLCNIRQLDWIPAQVPGDIYAALLKTGKMPDPFFGDNEYQAKALMEEDYEYKTVFNYEETQFKDCQEVILRFDGIDTIADIYLNGCCLGKVDNMHRIWEFPVGDKITPVLNWQMTRDDSDFGYLLSIETDDSGTLSLSGSGQIDGGKLNGTYKISQDDTAAAVIEVKDYDTESAKEGYLNGNYTITFPADSSEDTDSSLSMLENFALVLDLNSAKDSGSVALSVESAGSTLGSFTVTSGAGESVEIPDLTALGDVYDVTNEDDMSAYAATLDLTTLMDNLSNAGVPDEVITYVLSGGSNSDAEDVTDENASEAESDAESAEAGAA